MGRARIGMAKPVIENIEPAAGVEGGEVILTCSGFEPPSWRGTRVTFDGISARPESASASRVVVPVLTGPSGVVALRVYQDEEASEAAEFRAAEKIAENLHPVANPAIDRDNG